MKYISLLKAIELHDKIVDEFGGIKGYNQTQIGYLEGALEHIQNDLYYPNLEDKVSHLMFSCVKFHPFSDGNKRTSIALSNMFLKLNDITLNADNFNETMENIVIKIATNEISKDDLRDIFKNFIFNNKLNEIDRLLANLPKNIETDHTGQIITEIKSLSINFDNNFNNKIEKIAEMFFRNSISKDKIREKFMQFLFETSNSKESDDILNLKNSNQIVSKISKTKISFNNDFNDKVSNLVNEIFQGNISKDEIKEKIMKFLIENSMQNENINKNRNK